MLITVMLYYWQAHTEANCCTLRSVEAVDHSGSSGTDWPVSPPRRQQVEQVMCWVVLITQDVIHMVKTEEGQHATDDTVIEVQHELLMEFSILHFPQIEEALLGLSNCGGVNASRQVLCHSHTKKPTVCDSTTSSEWIGNLVRTLARRMHPISVDALHKSNSCRRPRDISKHHLNIWI